MPVFSLGSNSITVNGIRTPFEFPVRRATVFRDLVLVLLSTPFDKDELDNLYAMDADGEIAWRVKEPTGQFAIPARLPYEGIQVTDRGEILVTDFMGRRFLVSSEDGRIIGRDCIK